MATSLHTNEDTHTVDTAQLNLRPRNRLGKHASFWIGGGLIAVTLVIIMRFLLLPSGASNSPNYLANGHIAPNFSLQSNSGQLISLAQFKGHPVLLNFWATYCAPCRTETPLLERTLQTYQQQGLVIIGIDQGEPMDAITQFGQQYDLTYPLAGDFKLSVNRQFGVTSLPASYFIDAKGIIRASVNGVLLPDTLNTDLQSIGIALQSAANP